MCTVTCLTPGDYLCMAGLHGGLPLRPQAFGDRWCPSINGFIGSDRPFAKGFRPRRIRAADGERGDDEEDVMNQLKLFDPEQQKPDAKASEACTIRSGQAGPIRFGATEGSYAMTQEILDDLARLPVDAGDDCA